MNFISQNWLNIVGVAGTVGTIGFGILSVIIYFRSIQKPIPKYAVDPLRVRIVDRSKAEAPDLEVLHEGQAVKAQNVTAATIYFWNAGRAPIRKADVLQPFIINIDKSAELLDISLVNMTRPVCNFNLIVPLPRRNDASIAFDVMEENDGMTIQCIYAGKPDSVISFNGVAVGAPNVTPLRLALNDGEEVVGPIVWCGVCLAFVFMFVMASQTDMSKVFGLAALSIAVLIVTVFGSILSQRTRRTVPVRLRQPR